jgi:Flp pilus assembly protein TadD
VALDRPADAEAELRRALALESRPWVAGRTHAELGKIADRRGDRAAARMHFQQAARLAEQDNDSIGAAAARPWIRTSYKR